MKMKFEFWQKGIKQPNKFDKLRNDAHAQRYLDNMARTWASNLMPQVADDSVDPNNGSLVYRVSENELLIFTTGKNCLRFTVLP